MAVRKIIVPGFGKSAVNCRLPVTVYRGGPTIFGGTCQTAISSCWRCTWQWLGAVVHGGCSHCLVREAMLQSVAARVLGLLPACRTRRACWYSLCAGMPIRDALFSGQLCATRECEPLDCWVTFQARVVSTPLSGVAWYYRGIP